MTTKKAKGSATGPANQAQVRFNENANSDKVSETGFDFFSGVLLGELNTAAVLVTPNRPIYVFNNSAVVQYVAFSQNPAMPAPATGAAGVPIAPYSGIVLASGENTYIRASAVTVFGYEADDNVVNGS